MSKNKKSSDKTRRTSAGVQNNSLEKLRTVFPQFVKDGQIDFDALKSFFDEQGLTAKDEKYGLGWAGKSEAFNLIRQSATGTLTPDKDESKDWDKTQNLFIEGDNLEALKLLQAHYREQIKMIYIDPPYNTGGDFIYHDNFRESKEDYETRTGQRTEAGRLMKNTESGGRYHSDWLTMMYPRLFLAKNLLKDDGVIFISIDDHEVHNLRHICDEIFGEENFIDSIVWKKRYGGGSKEKHLVTVHEYILVYARNLNELDDIFVDTSEDQAKRYYTLKDEKHKIRGGYRTHPLEAGKAMDTRKNLIFPITAPDGSEITPKRQWLWSKERVETAIKNNDLEFSKTKDGWNVATKQYLRDEYGEIRQTKAFSLIDDVYSQHGTNEIIDIFGDARIFSYPKPASLLKQIIKIGFQKDSGIILDFFGGSGSIAHAVTVLNAEGGENRKYIMVQLDEETDEESEAKKAGYNNIAEIARERIRRSGEKVKADYKDELAERETPLDIGFKAYQLTPSNYRQWNTITAEDDEETLKKQMELFAKKPLVDDYNEQSVVYEVLLKEGFSLNSKVVQENNDGLSFWRVTYGDKQLIVTFSQELTKEQVEVLKLPKDTTFVCLDSALDDTTKVNLSRNLTVKTV